MNTDFINDIARLTGTESLADVLCNTPAETSIRLNPRKPGYVPEEFDGYVSWYDRGCYLSCRPQFTLIPQLHSGAFYVQDSSSMFTATVLRQVTDELGDHPLVYLDACAAPGGKTTAAIDNLPDGSLVVANEFDARRCAALRENIIRWGYPCTIVTRGDAAKIGKCRDMFDVVACDLPCSGEGMMRKEPEAVRQWSRNLVRDCAKRQTDIVSALIPALKPGGFLIYSTCTFNTAENELNIAHIIESTGMLPVKIRNIPENSGIMPGEPVSPLVPPECCTRFYPGKIRGEGQFVALLRKPGVWKPYSAKEAAKRKPTNVDRLLTNSGQFTISPDFTAFPTRYLSQLKSIKAATDIVCAGIELGTQKGKDFIPAHQLALSTCLNRDAYPVAELSYDNAIDYLRGNSPHLPEGTPRGIVLVTYKSFPLGFAKNLGNRANTLLPAQHRIKNL